LDSNRWRGLIDFLGLSMLTASLVFVGLQMQQDRKIAIAQLNTSQLEMFASRINAGLESEPYLSMWNKIYGTARWNAEGMSDLEVAAAELDALVWWSYAEMAFESYREGLMSDHAWSEMEGEIRLMVVVPPIRAVYDAWWSQSPSDFTRVVDRILAESASEAADRPSLR
jgi:hypothetical protein